VANYWSAVNGRQVDLGFGNLDAAKQFLLKHLGEDEAALALVEVYDGDHPIRQILWSVETQDWIEVP
jgi:hypothetical protein